MVCTATLKLNVCRCDISGGYLSKVAQQNNCVFITSAGRLTGCDVCGHVPDVMMHLMNSKFTMMDFSRASTAGGDEAGAASSSRRSRACQTQEHWQIAACSTLERYCSSRYWQLEAAFVETQNRTCKFSNIVLSPKRHVIVSEQTWHLHTQTGREVMFACIQHQSVAFRVDSQPFVTKSLLGPCHHFAKPAPTTHKALHPRSFPPTPFITADACPKDTTSRVTVFGLVSVHCTYGRKWDLLKFSFADNS